MAQSSRLGRGHHRNTHQKETSCHGFGDRQNFHPQLETETYLVTAEELVNIKVSVDLRNEFQTALRNLLKQMRDVVSSSMASQPAAATLSPAALASSPTCSAVPSTSRKPPTTQPANTLPNTNSHAETGDRSRDICRAKESASKIFDKHYNMIMLDLGPDHLVGIKYQPTAPHQALMDARNHVKTPSNPTDASTEGRSTSFMSSGPSPPTSSSKTNFTRISQECAPRQQCFSDYRSTLLSLDSCIKLKINHPEFPFPIEPIKDVQMHTVLEVLHSNGNLFESTPAGPESIFTTNKSLLRKYSDVYDVEKHLKVMDRPTIVIHLKPNVTPSKVSGPRPIPLPLHERAKKMLDELESSSRRFLCRPNVSTLCQSLPRGKN
ncbi:unnamed protein product [Lepeophtheirus salmonis]|uniref:(salmon louse) hypothetical protein n=1 Tax=Lepeophtheirus salmonis TaxID=72036 RepID=A0A7R8H219_LEPSM|nr:unnamed protein product [Lepeophtheirus salmonis]CAF2817426.1 unnamed protein product [Lepeophtheirus salmonis]